MDKRPERRQAARLTIPSQFSGRTLAHPPVRLVDLSLQGARIEHPDPLNAGLICLLDLPPALGRGSLTGRVVWTKPHRNEQTLEGARQRYYRSGLAWTGLTPAQQGAWRPRWSSSRPPRRPRRRHTPPKPGGRRQEKAASTPRAGSEAAREEKGMIQHSKQRRVERLSVPRHCRGAGRGATAVALLDLSPAGARIEHGEPLPDWSGYPMDLPRALGGGRVRAQVVWSRVPGHQPGVEGNRKLVFQSGLAFPHRTPEEQAALWVALVRLAGEWALGMLRDLRRQAEHDPAHQPQFDSLCGETLGWLRREIEALRFTKAH